ncbi:MAG TPA: protocatechuate 3,4-dioxygenase subunit beta [Actinomycetota bacterium]|nr:protocatechuate 3,4-dioxygenase subunit beta [Actinomycetota bacterium]
MAEGRWSRRAERPGEYPAYLFEAYRSTSRRAPTRPLLEAPLTLSELSGPGPAMAGMVEPDADLTTNAGTGGEAIGERIIVTGRVLDADGRPQPGTLVEVWQANAAGRYHHERDLHGAPLDPNFLGLGWCLTDDDGRYRFLTIKPGAYPWPNDPNSWRPAHIHFSLFGPSFVTRLITQMYFPGDPLLPLDPIFNSIPDEGARARLVARYDHQVTQPMWALGFVWDIVLAGPRATPFEDAERRYA